MIGEVIWDHDLKDRPSWLGSWNLRQPVTCLGTRKCNIQWVGLFHLDHTSKSSTASLDTTYSRDQVCKHVRHRGHLHPKHNEDNSLWGSEYPQEMSHRQSLGIGSTKGQGCIVQWVSVTQRVNLRGKSLLSSTYNPQTYSCPGKRSYGFLWQPPKNYSWFNCICSTKRRVIHSQGKSMAGGKGTRGQRQRSEYNPMP